MKLKDIPWYNRPGSKLKSNGVSSLDNAELLAIIYGYGNKKHNAVELSNQLLLNKNLHQFHLSTIEELKLILKDEIKAYKTLALGELFKRYSKLKQYGYKKTLLNASDVFQVIKHDITGKKKEHLFAIYLDTKSRIIGQPKLISMGLLDKALVHPREVFKDAIKSSAKAVVVVHNHPSGDCKPSDPDIKITELLRKGGKILGIELLDHVIVTDKNYYSLREHCWK